MTPFADDDGIVLNELAQRRSGTLTKRSTVRVVRLSRTPESQACLDLARFQTRQECNFKGDILGACLSRLSFLRTM